MKLYFDSLTTLKVIHAESPVVIFFGTYGMHVSKIEKSPDYTVCPVCNRMQDHLLVLKERKNPKHMPAVPRIACCLRNL